MTWMRKAMAVAAVLMVGLAIAPAVRATCNPPQPGQFVGNLGFASSVEWTSDDPLASFSYYFVGRPDVNEGDYARVFRDFVTPAGPDETLVLGLDLGGDTPTTGGCPTLVDPTGTTARGVFIMGDSEGTVIVTTVGPGLQWNWDFAAINTTRVGPVFQLPLLERSGSLNPRVLSSERMADDRAEVALSWAAPKIWSDDPTAVIGIAGYSIHQVTVLSGREANDPERSAPRLLQDQDLNPGDTSARVIMDPTPGQDSFLYVRADFDNSGGRGAMGGASARLMTDPALAVPGHGQGKGKGLIKAPGQNR